jgi:hypothetical protein
MLSATAGCRADLATTLADALRRAEREEAPPAAAADEEEDEGGVLEEHEARTHTHTRLFALVVASVFVARC